MLGRHFGWNIDFVATPYLRGIESTRKSMKIWTDVWESREKDFQISDKSTHIGDIVYSSNEICKLMSPPNNNAQYSLEYHNQKKVIGLHIPSHRPVVSYFKLDTIPTSPKTNQQQFQEFQQLLFQTYNAASSRNPGLILKQNLVALAIFGYGNNAVQADEEYRDLFERFQEILRNILPKSLGFLRLEVRMPEIILITESGDFPLDSMSGGVSAVFGMAWQIHIFGADKDKCTVIIDEPENHLHPSMQREFLPGLKEAFPNYKFIISTHSPFIITSDPDATVYGLVYNQNKRIISHKLSQVDLSGSPNKILREILDVPTTLPLWVEQRIKSIFEKYGKIENEEYRADSIFEELKQLGLSESIGEYFEHRDEK